MEYELSQSYSLGSYRSMERPRPITLSWVSVHDHTLVYHGDSGTDHVIVAARLIFEISSDISINTTIGSMSTAKTRTYNVRPYVTYSSTWFSGVLLFHALKSTDIPRLSLEFIIPAPYGIPGWAKLRVRTCPIS